MPGMLASDPEAVKKPGAVSALMSRPQIARRKAGCYTCPRIREQGTCDDGEFGQGDVWRIPMWRAGIRRHPFDATCGAEKVRSLHIDLGAGGHSPACRWNEAGTGRALQQLRLQPPTQDAGRWH